VLRKTMQASGHPPFFERSGSGTGRGDTLRYDSSRALSGNKTGLPILLKLR
jgi:hypothetical protein